ncbi:MAG: FtsH protease activity modulator HflK [Pseudomonadales bacterium]|nr:FtsH protease activity modulator HflK [Pseudomonadales bacterium]
MAWNEPGRDDRQNDPWGGKGAGKGGGGNNDQGPPDLDELLKQLRDTFLGVFGLSGGNGNGGDSKGASAGGVSIFVALLAGLIFFLGVFQVDEKERAVVLRFGVFKEVVNPGLHWRIPLVETVYQENTTSYRVHLSRGQMLTKDVNIVEVELSVQYNIANIKDFVLNVKTPENSLAQATDSAVRHVVGSSLMDDVLTLGRDAIAAEVQTRLQTYLDNYGTGIRIEKVNLESTQAPDEVRAAFDDVTKAREDEERVQNEAEAYANGIIPEARGQAQRIVQEATAYKDQVIARAEGEAQRFVKLLSEYEKAPEVTRQRLYIDAIQGVMGQSSKVMVDVDGGNNMIYLPLDKLVEQSSTVGTNKSSAPLRLSADDIDTISLQVLNKLKRDLGNSDTRRTGREAR